MDYLKHTELRHSMMDDDELAHAGHKYTRKVRGSNGKWVYYYETDNGGLRSGSGLGARARYSMTRGANYARDLPGNIRAIPGNISNRAKAARMKSQIRRGNRSEFRNAKKALDTLRDVDRQNKREFASAERRMKTARAANKAKKAISDAPSRAKEAARVTRNRVRNDINAAKYKASTRSAARAKAKNAAIGDAAAKRRKKRSDAAARAGAQVWRQNSRAMKRQKRRG